MHTTGEGVPQNDAEAVKWYRLAAEQGNADAQFAFGVMYEKGEGVPKDYILAHMWFNLAASRGSSSGTKNRDIVAGFMTRAQIAEAQQRAWEWKPRIERAGFGRARSFIMGLFRIHAAPFIGVVLYAPGNLRLYQVDAQLADFFRRDPAPGAPARSHGSQQFSFRQTPLCASSQTDRTASGGGHSRQRRLSADSAGGRALGGMTAKVKVF